MSRALMLFVVALLSACGSPLWDADSIVDGGAPPVVAETLFTQSEGGLRLALVWEVHTVWEEDLERCFREVCPNWQYDAASERRVTRFLSRNIEALDYQIGHVTLNLSDAPPPEALFGVFEAGFDGWTHPKGWRASGHIALYEDVDGDGELSFPGELWVGMQDRIIATSGQVIEYLDGTPEYYQRHLDQGYNLVGRRREYFEARDAVDEMYRQCVLEAGMQPSSLETYPGVDYTHADSCLFPCGNPACQEAYWEDLASIRYLSSSIRLQTGPTLELELDRGRSLRSSTLCAPGVGEPQQTWTPGTGVIMPDSIETVCLDGGLSMWWRETEPVYRTNHCIAEPGPSRWYFRRYPRDKLPVDWPCDVTGAPSETVVPQD